MALVSFPTAPIGSYTIALDIPGQRVYRSLYSGNIDVLDRGIARWSGTITWGQHGALERAQINDIETFLLGLGGAANQFDFAIPNLDQSTRFSGAVNAISFERAGTRAELELSESATNEIGLRAGDYITMGHRMYRVVNTQIDEGVVVTPGEFTSIQFPAAINYTTPRVRARAGASEIGIAFSQDADFAGPWTLEWVESY